MGRQTCLHKVFAKAVRYWTRSLNLLKGLPDLPISEETLKDDCHGEQDQEDPDRATARGGFRTHEHGCDQRRG